MSTSNNTTNVITQDCSGCGKSKPASEFTRQRGNKKIIGSTCNKSNQFFFPRFLATLRHHDYPFITFGEMGIPRINANNNPWNNVLHNKVLETMPVSESSSIQNTSALVTNRYEIIENRKDELSSDLKMFETLVKIINNNIENDKLYEAYKVLRQPLVNETIACNEALNAKKQQKTWKSRKTYNLAFWLQ
ncbi:9232_t:CDS:2 [Dentiscutata heterogama]|uniref:9232_t:CDS:1 n=1 Tax=Dentiscutata heterogama TaxID=1316150 RepID=A0ACA9N4K0_9GLOM|nr:9232_t:CDS:2 [Dentiscutata heterogama]